MEVDENSPENKMRTTMCKLWTNFAKYHDPTPKFDNPLSFVWKPTECVDKNATDINFDYIILDRELKMEKNTNKSRMDFWRSVFKTWNQDFAKPKL